MTTSARILVIEQDHMIQVLLHDILESEGYRPLVTGSWLVPEDVRQLRPTAILIDPFIHGEDSGWDYLRRLRAYPGLARIPIIVCTADANRLREITADQLALANSVILKPFELDELLDAIIAVTGTSATPSSPSLSPVLLENQAHRENG